MRPWRPKAHLGGVCLLVETDEGPVLVDTGLGMAGHTQPSPKVRFLSKVTGIQKDPEQPAVRQIEKLGWQPEKIRHIVLTHLHFDHAGGLPDFPHAWVHVHQQEYAAMRKPRSLLERLGYNKDDFAHGPKWVFHDEVDTRWLGLDAIRLEFKPEILLIPLPGHTRGHCGVVVREGEGWLFFCGSALPLNVQPGLLPVRIQQFMSGPHIAKLEALGKAHPEVRMIAGHMGIDFFVKKIERYDPS